MTFEASAAMNRKFQQLKERNLNFSLEDSTNLILNNEHISYDEKIDEFFFPMNLKFTRLSNTVIN